jgi:hypothetical protein
LKVLLKVWVFYADPKSKVAATTGHIVLTQDHMGKYRNIFFSEAIALIEPKLHQSLEGPLQTLCFLC